MNPLLLAIETSSDWTSVALARGGHIISEYSVESRSRHNEVLAPLIGEVLSETHKSFSDLELLGVSIGPGSFTALRIGLLVAKGIALAGSLKIVPVMTLDVLNASLEENGETFLRMPVMDAYKGEVFTAVYEGAKRVSEPQIVAPSQLASFLESSSRERVKVFGPALRRYLQEIRESFKERLILAEEDVIPRVSILARLAFDGRAKACDPSGLEPFYLRKPDAKKPKA